jgi:hypothetical protein
MKVGEVFFLPDWLGGHWNFVLEEFPDGAVLIFNFTDHSKHSDKTCAIEIGEHPCITKKSVVNYRQPQHCEDAECADQVEKVISKRFKEPLSEALIIRIRQGALKSAYTADKIKTLIAENHK